MSTTRSCAGVSTADRYFLRTPDEGGGGLAALDKRQSGGICSSQGTCDEARDSAGDPRLK